MKKKIKKMVPESAGAGAEAPVTPSRWKEGERAMRAIIMHQSLIISKNLCLNEHINDHINYKIEAICCG